LVSCFVIVAIYSFVPFLISINEKCKTHKRLLFGKEKQEEMRPDTIRECLTKSSGYVSGSIPNGILQLHDSPGISPGSMFQLQKELYRCFAIGVQRYQYK